MVQNTRPSVPSNSTPPRRSVPQDDGLCDNPTPMRQSPANCSCETSVSKCGGPSSSREHRHTDSESERPRDCEERLVRHDIERKTRKPSGKKGSSNTSNQRFVAMVITSTPEITHDDV